MKSLATTIAAILLTASSASAAVKGIGIAYKVNEQQFYGYAAYDDSIEGKRPGVLVFHEWWGLNDYARKRADELAELGYVALAVDMYGDGKTTTHPNEAREMATKVRQNADEWLHRAKQGLDILLTHPNVDPENVAAIGYCFGGSTVLQLAFSGADLKAVASFHGALVVPTDEQVQQTKATIFVAHGASDTFIPEETAGKFRAALEKGRADYFMTYYGNAKHSFTVPDADSHKIEGIAYQREADERSWKHMQMLLKDVFGES